MAMTRTVVLNVVGLSGRHLRASMPKLSAWAGKRGMQRIRPALPAVTCTAQATYLTGTKPSQHGIVANGWYHRELAEVQFWKQSNHLVHGRKIWEDLRSEQSSFTCAKLFWWYNMYSSADWSITPRPMYPADGRKFFDVYAWPYQVRSEVKAELGEFPFPGFWGPAAGVKSPAGGPACATEWIANSARWMENRHSPGLSLVYLPHLDYNLQRLGPLDPRCEADYRLMDELVSGLIEFYEARKVRVLVLSEYGITPVSRPVHLNRRLRELGWLTIKEELGLELLDAGNSEAFAVADHQVAHVYLKNPGRWQEVKRELGKVSGVATVLGPEEMEQLGLRHERAGDLMVLAEPDSWFTYYYWMEDARAPDFARCVDIHRKPGYDPVELFLDPGLRMPKLKIARRLIQKKLGFRMLMDVIPLDAGLVKGSHGIRPPDHADYPVLLGADGAEEVEAESVYGVIRTVVRT